MGRCSTNKRVILVANYCAQRIHEVVADEWQRGYGGESWQRRWEIAFSDGFQRVDDEVISEAVGPEIVGSTAVAVVISGCQIIDSNCGDSRAILCRGERYLRPLVILVPEISFTARSEEDDCLILASDGLWDVMSNDEVSEVACRLLRHQRRIGVVGVGSLPLAQVVADRLSVLAFQRDSSDNITVIVVDLKSRKQS